MYLHIQKMHTIMIQN